MPKRPWLESERQFVAKEIAPLVGALRTRPELRRAFAEFCVKAGGDVMTVPTRIKHLVAGRPVGNAFLFAALFRFGHEQGLIPEKRRK